MEVYFLFFDGQPFVTFCAGAGLPFRCDTFPSISFPPNTILETQVSTEDASVSALYVVVGNQTQNNHETDLEHVARQRSPT